MKWSSVHWTVVRTLRILLLVLFVAALSGCEDYGDPSATVTTMITAMDQMDVQTAMAQFEPAVQQTYEGGMGVAGSIVSGITGFDISFADASKLLPALKEFAGAQGEPMPQMRVHETKWAMDPTHTYSLVLADVTTQIPDEDGVMQDDRSWTPFLLQRMEGEWRILGMESSIDQATLAWPGLAQELDRLGMSPTTSLPQQ